MLESILLSSSVSHFMPKLVNGLLFNDIAMLLSKCILYLHACTSSMFGNPITNSFNQKYCECIWIFFDLKELKLQVYYVFNMQLFFSAFHLFLGSPENTAKSNSSNSGSSEHDITFPQ